MAFFCRMLFTKGTGNQGGEGTDHGQEWYIENVLEVSRRSSFHCPFTPFPLAATAISVCL